MIIQLGKKSIRNSCKERQLKAYRHNGFWQCMDTLRDKNFLEELWINGKRHGAHGNKKRFLERSKCSYNWSTGFKEAGSVFGCRHMVQIYQE